MPNSSIRWISTHLRRLWFLLLPLRPPSDPPSDPLPLQDRSPAELRAILAAAPLGGLVSMSASEARSLAAPPPPPEGEISLRLERSGLTLPPEPIRLPWRTVVSGLTFYYQVPKIPRWLRRRHPQLSPLLLRHSKSRLRWNPPMQAPCRRSARSRLRHRGRLLPWAVKRRVLAQFRRPFRPKRPARVTGLHRGLRR